MATLLFDDIDFPNELYVQETGEFATPVRTLLQFTPHILENLAKQESEQEPIHPKETEEHLKYAQEGPRSATEPNTQPWWSSWLATESTKKIAQESFKFCLEMARLYMEQSQWRERHEATRGDFHQQTESQKKRKSEEEEKEEEKEKEREKKEKQKEREEKAVETQSDHYATAVSAAAGISALTLSLYSTYKFSSSVGQITFYNQLTLLLEHVETILETTRFWMQEQVDPIPPMVKKDVERIEKLVDLIHRLDRRSEKKMEATAWAAGALGSLGLVGGVVVGSTMALGGGAVVALGGLFYGVYSRGQYSSKQYSDIREMLESEAKEILRHVGEKQHAAKLIDQFRQVRPKVYDMSDFPEVPEAVPNTANRYPAQDEAFVKSATNQRQKERAAQTAWA
ncbi:hypothetical protein K493DRAFT_314964 [Basidiobolus meristosporus CBS 931.73]|uniref:Uncharacterized protein n=1 Tax=Basidiobolus meristosporus CBS 931.73 TaxID=1314790 RepID=A0A1Y1YBY2_9FUNG|nr:hypothetical protein K493DRAFT_314964 [Basidiobolus meristosporus CBS 931.73]|eukprot:ORX95530.1 hypothetical protein K493DRAFT_314964 [Basidiobolus meristosporus CBS 931.73]